MDNIDKSHVVGQSGAHPSTRILVQAEISAGVQQQFFTFDKGSGGQLSLVSMSGPQRGVSG